MEDTADTKRGKVTNVVKGTRFRFVTYIDGEAKQLTGSVIWCGPSAKARKLGLTKSRRMRLGMLLKVEGYDKPFYKDKGQVTRVESER